MSYDLGKYTKPPLGRRLDTPTKQWRHVMKAVVALTKRGGCISQEYREGVDLGYIQHTAEPLATHVYVATNAVGVLAAFMLVRVTGDTMYTLAICADSKEKGSGRAVMLYALQDARTTPTLRWATLDSLRHVYWLYPRYGYLRNYSIVGDMKKGWRYVKNLRNAVNWMSEHNADIRVDRAKHDARILKYDVTEPPRPVPVSSNPPPRPPRARPPPPPRRRRLAPRRVVPTKKFGPNPNPNPSPNPQFGWVRHGSHYWPVSTGETPTPAALRIPHAKDATYIVYFGTREFEWLPPTRRVLPFDQRPITDKAIAEYMKVRKTKPLAEAMVRARAAYEASHS